MKQTYFLYKSTNPDKKYMIKFINEATNRKNTLHFGSSQYSDYTLTNNERRKELYKLRHASDNINDLSYPGCWSWHLLWNKTTLEKSIIDMQKKFNIIIVNNLLNHLENIHKMLEIHHY